MAESTRKTAAAKAAQNQADETKDVETSDPTAANPEAEQAGITTAGVGEDSVLVKPEDRIEDAVFASTGSADELVTIQKDVVEEFYYPGTKRPAQRILFTKGQVVRRAYIDALNARVDAANTRRGRESAGEPAPLEELIDPTTIAAGTGSQPPVQGDGGKVSDKEE